MGEFGVRDAWLDGSTNLRLETRMADEKNAPAGREAATHSGGVKPGFEPGEEMYRWASAKVDWSLTAGLAASVREMQLWLDLLRGRK